MLIGQTFASKGNGSSKVRKAAGIEISRDGTDSDDIMYVVSHSKNKIQKVQINDGGTADCVKSCTVTSLAEAGRKKRANNTAIRRSTCSRQCKLWRPGTAIAISSGKIWITDQKGSVQEFNENIFER